MLSEDTEAQCHAFAQTAGPVAALLHSLADLLFHVLCFLRTSSLGRMLYASREAELRIRLLLPALVDHRGWGGEQDLSSNPLSTLHLSEIWDLLADVASPVGVHYMLLRHTLFGTMIELQLAKSTSLAHFGFRASDEGMSMWCRGSFVVRGAFQCRNWIDVLDSHPRRMPITQDTLAKQSSFKFEHCGDRFVLRPVKGELRPQLQLTKRGFISIAAEGGGVIVEDGQPARRIESTVEVDDIHC
mmetsp:Transcript_69819/g.123858  ORF Transcript_69819/g.123858 Transcript_69819/m.123858 type:complete len:243 (-) Transcript_69819:7-735(-)